MSDALKDVITAMAFTLDQDLLDLPESELAEQWYFKWDDKASVAWNIYQFSDMLELHRKRCRRWEEHHNGSCCVVERVRDTYLMPRARAFEAELLSHLTTEGTSKTADSGSSRKEEKCKTCKWHRTEHCKDCFFNEFWETPRVCETEEEK